MAKSNFAGIFYLCFVCILFVFFVNFDVDACVAPGDAYAIGVQSDTDLGGNTYWYANLVFQWDYTSLLPGGTEKR